MEPVVLTLASNERYFPGLYCAVMSALCHLNTAREADVRVLDGGLSERSREILSHLVARFGRRFRLELVPIDESVFRGATLGPGQSHMTYCRILLPHLLGVPRLIYLDCDVLVFRDLSELFDIELSPGKILAAVPDSETLTLADDSQALVDATNLPADGRYCNAGVMLLNLDELRKENFTNRSLEFFSNWKGHYRFWDQSAFNFLLHGRIDELPEHWNRASWRFDEQENNNLECVLHYTGSVPWLVGTPGPAQELFERFAAEVGQPINRSSPLFRKSVRLRFWRNGLAPLRALAFPLASLLCRLAGKENKAAGYQKAARYWFDYIRNAPSRRQLHRRRSQEIRRIKFELHALPLAS
jgi:lipopolysaccharide biosynthesis glycosyltransferase